jgi:hypothetical protein
MKNIVKFGLAGIAALALSSTLTNSTAQNVVKFLGTYNITEGTTPNGDSYTGTMTISEWGDGYKVKQVFAGGTYNGIGSEIGDALGVAYLIDGVPSVSIYQVTAANTLEGYWQDAGNTKEGYEKAILVGKAFSFAPSTVPTVDYNYAGTYGIQGLYSDKTTSYTGSMILSKYGNGYRASFSGDGTVGTGIASIIGKNIAISWNFKDNLPNISIFEANAATGEMIGYWQRFDDKKEGSEVATRR